MPTPPVDLVITWVNGQDPLHIAKRKLRSAQFPNIEQSSIHNTRFDNCGELDWCVRSWLKYAPWVRKTYIVTDAQVPSIVQQLALDNIIVIDHQLLFQDIESALPTFNSVSIESVLWRIPGLSDNFIYCNDDCFLIRKVNYNDFFCKDALVVRGKWKRQQHLKWYKRGAVLPFHTSLQQNSARHAGFTDKYLHLPHMPFALHKRLFLQNTELWLENAMHPFRVSTQVWPISWQHHLASKNQISENTRLKAVMLNGETYSMLRVIKRLLRATLDYRVKCICMQSLDQAPSNMRTQIFSWLARMI